MLLFCVLASPVSGEITIPIWDTRRRGTKVAVELDLWIQQK